MDYTASTGQAGESYEKPAAGRYVGVLIGFASVGTHDGQFGEKARVMLRWELHKRKGPALDSEGRPHTVTATYNSSFDAKSTLRKVVEAHIGRVHDGMTVKSAQWLGKGAVLTLVESEPNARGKTYVNVKDVIALDPEDDVLPTAKLEESHWEIEHLSQGPKPPAWCMWAVQKSKEFTAAKNDGDSWPWEKENGNGNGQHAVAQAGSSDRIPY